MAEISFKRRQQFIIKAIDTREKYDFITKTVPLPYEVP